VTENHHDSLIDQSLLISVQTPLLLLSVLLNMLIERVLELREIRTWPVKGRDIELVDQRR